MLSNRSIGIRTLSLGWLLLLVTAGFWIWVFVWDNDSLADHTALQRYLLYNEFLLVGILFGTGGKRQVVHGPHKELIAAVRRSGRQTAAALGCVFVAAFVLADTAVSRSFFLSYIPWLFLTLVFSNYLMPRWLGRWAFSGVREERVALAGTIEQARQIKTWLDSKSLLGFRTVGLVCPEKSPDFEPSNPAIHPMVGRGSRSQTAAFPVLGTIESLDEIFQRASITQLIVLDLSLGPERLQKLAHLCERAAVRLLAVHDLNCYFNHTTMTFEDDGVRFIGLREEPLESPINRFVKRVMDLAIATPVILFVLPLTTALVWLVQRVQSPGPVFFRQARIGIKGQPFRVLKYRTMHVNGHRESAQASKDDPRIYPAGRWLRKISLDELPQFVNVFKGEMSVVGPRPHLQEHDELWMRVMGKYIIRRFIRPGITGWAQVNGFRGEIHSETDIQKRVEADIHYLENWSFSLDCVIVLKTIKHCVAPPSSAY